MVLSSLIFVLFFLPLTLALHYASPKILRNLILLAGSLVFYAWGEKLYVLILIASILINYFGGLFIDRHRDKPSRKQAFITVIIMNVLLLCVFKYTNFLVDSLNAGLALFHLPGIFIAPVHLPIGISFFTFQALSYIIDVYKGKEPVQRSPLKVGLFISLFPQLIAGPIVRYKHVARELDDRSIDANRFALGIERFIIGLAKKVLVADSIAVASDALFGLPTSELTPGLAWLGGLCGVFSVYFDFCGYSDMAVGLGYMLGFRFPENFNYPCAARSMHDFWTRWHITFTRWIRDYLFIPMGGLRRPAKGSRFPQARLYWIILLVFLLVGLWHGARWNFVIWGGLHGLLIIIERVGLLNRIKKWPAPFQHAYVLAAFTTIGIFFMTPTPGHAARFIAAMYGYFHGDGVIHNMAFYLDGRTAFYFIVACIASTPLLPRLKAWKAGRFSGPGKSDARLRIILSASYNIYLLFLFVLSLMSMASGVYHPFVYYRF